MRRLDSVPVTLFVYRRPETVERVLGCLRREQIETLYIFADGASHPEYEDDVRAVRRLIEGVDWCDTVVVAHDRNLGLGVSVKTGINHVVARHDATIVIEDDLVFVPGTYAYLCDALRHYRDDDRVMSVTGWTHPRITPPDLAEQPYFDGKAECWVWGTWRRAWAGMERPALDIMELCREAGIDIMRYGTDLPKMAAEAQRKNLWAVGWFYHHMLRAGLCLRPPYSLAEQICWDESRSTTTTGAMVGWQNPPLRGSVEVPAVWPEPVEHNCCAPLWRQAIDGLD